MENGIKERKRRRNRFFACVPLCICVTVFTVMMLPNMIPIRESADSVENEMAADLTVSDPQILFTSMEIVDSSYSAEKNTVSTDAGEVDMLYTDIQGLFDKSVPENYDGAVVPDNLNEEVAAEDVTITSNIAHPKYTITFCSSYGDRIVYEISGNSLICRTADHEDETVLTQGALMELISKLTSLLNGKENAE